MFRARIWLPIAVASSAVTLWCAIELIRFRPELRPWVAFLLALSTSAVSWPLTLVTKKLDQMARRDEPQSTGSERLEVVAFDRSSPRIRRIES